MSRTPVKDAELRALRLYPNSKGFQGAYVRGARAKLAGRPIDSCPYRRDPEKTWRIVWRAAWIHGWQSVVGDLPLDEAMERGEV